MFERTRRAWSAVAAAGFTALALTAPLSAVAQDSWPAKEIHLVVPWPAGGESDRYARALAQDLTARLKQPVLVENRAGATGAIGITHVVRSRPDGYTFLFGNTTSVVGNVVSSSVPVQFDPLTDLAPVALTVDSSYVLWAHPSLGIRSVDQLVQRARDKAKPQLAFGITGPGALSELSVEQLARHYKLDLLKVAYKGSAPQLADLIGGHTQIGTADPSVALSHYKEGRLVPLLVIGQQRLSELPDTPTLAELGIGGPDLTIWNGLFAPVDVPQPILQAFTQAVGESVRSDVYKNAANTTGSRAIFQPGAEAAARVRRDLDERRSFKAQVEGGL